MVSSKRRFFCALFLCTLLTGCALVPPSDTPDRLLLEPTEFSALPDWTGDGGKAAALRAFLRSCAAFEKMDPTAMVGKAPLALPASAWQGACAVARDVPARDEQQSAQFFTTYFAPFRVRNNDTQHGLLTGYYEPLLYGSRTKQGRYRFPIYRMPPRQRHPEGAQRPEGSQEGTSGGPSVAALPQDDVTLPPREAIDRGALAGNHLEWLWVDDDIALFFLHIQGSGQVQLPDGSRVRVGYAGKNGHAYVAIGKVLVERGALTKEDVSMLSIRHWLWNHPHAAREVLWQNPSYVFFREIEGDGPIGSQGVALTAERSLAVDRRFIPLGMPVFVETTLPSPPLPGEQPYHHLLIAQDTGGAIKGPLRGDVFFGFGADAGLLAGFMKQPGKFTLLLPKESN